MLIYIILLLTAFAEEHSTEQYFELAQNYFEFALEDHGDLQLLHKSKDYLSKAARKNIDCKHFMKEYNYLAWFIHETRPYITEQEFSEQLVDQKSPYYELAHNICIQEEMGHDTMYGVLPMSKFIRNNLFQDANAYGIYEVIDEPKVVALSQSIERMIQVITEKLPDDITFDVRITVHNQEGEEDVELQNEVFFIVNQISHFSTRNFQKDGCEGSEPDVEDALLCIDVKELLTDGNDAFFETTATVFFPNKSDVKIITKGFAVDSSVSARYVMVFPGVLIFFLFLVIRSGWFPFPEIKTRLLTQVPPKESINRNNFYNLFLITPFLGWLSMPFFESFWTPFMPSPDNLFTVSFWWPIFGMLGIVFFPFIVLRYFISLFIPDFREELYPIVSMVTMLGTISILSTNFLHYIDEPTFLNYWSFHFALVIGLMPLGYYIGFQLSRDNRDNQFFLFIGTTFLAVAVLFFTLSYSQYSIVAITLLTTVLFVIKGLLSETDTKEPFEEHSFKEYLIRTPIFSSEVNYIDDVIVSRKNRIKKHPIFLYRGKKESRELFSRKVKSHIEQKQQEKYTIRYKEFKSELDAWSGFTNFYGGWEQ